jgi:hypothetical protein
MARNNRTTGDTFAMDGMPPLMSMMPNTRGTPPLSSTMPKLPATAQTATAPAAPVVATTNTSNNG